jgi:hypothetical protein
MASFEPETRVVLSADVVSRPIAGELLILDLASGRYHGLDPVGSRIWELIPDQHTVGAIAAALVQEYEVDEERVRADLDVLLREMAGKGLIRIE